MPYGIIDIGHIYNRTCHRSYPPLGLLYWYPVKSSHHFSIFGDQVPVNDIYIASSSNEFSDFTHWGRVTHICVCKRTIIGSNNGLSPGWRQAIIWTNAGILLIGPSGTNFREIVVGIHKFSFKERHLKMSSAKQQPFCLGLNESN